MAAPNYLLYMAHGDENYKNEVLGSVLSYLILQQSKPIGEKATILIYTDTPAYFRQILGNSPEIVYEEITADKWLSWRGAINFVHRTKVVGLIHAVDKHPGNMLFLDSDTYFVRDVADVFEALSTSQLFLHKKESIMQRGSLLHQQLYEFLHANAAPEWASLSPTTIMYNAGAIGLSSRKSSLLAEVLTRTEEMYKATPSHIMEQLAFSMTWAEAGPVGEVAPYVIHYWHMKDVRPILAAFFAKVAGQTLAQVMTAFAELPIVLASQQKDQWEARPRWQRGLLRVIGKGWRWPASA